MIGQEPGDRLTEIQELELLEDFDAQYGWLRIAEIRDAASGIRFLIPTGIVDYSSNQFPFTIFGPINESGVHIAAISLPGNWKRLESLYRSLRFEFELPVLVGQPEAQEFTISKVDNGLYSYAHAELKNGYIRGMVIRWPLSDGTPIAWIAQALTHSVSAFDNTDADLGLAQQTHTEPEPETYRLLDNFSKPEPMNSFSGFFVSDKGAVLTSARMISNCQEISIEGQQRVEIQAVNADTDLALLVPLKRLYPFQVARWASHWPKGPGRVWLGGYSHGNLLGQPTVAAGVSVAKTTNTNPSRYLVEVDARDGDYGGPIIGRSGGVIGMLIPKTASDLKLPSDTAVATGVEAIRNFLNELGIEIVEFGPDKVSSSAELVRTASSLPLLVQCH